MIVYSGKIERQKASDATGIVMETILFQVDINEASLRSMAKVAARNQNGKAIRGPFCVKVIGTMESFLAKA